MTTTRVVAADSGYARTEQLFQVLQDAERCASKPTLIRCGIGWFRRLMAELCHNTGLSFSASHFTLFDIRVELDWSLPSEELVLEFEP